MPLQLTKDSILHIPSDAVVHFISPEQIADKSFLSSEVFRSAGPGLETALVRWEDLAEASAVVTGSCELANCRFIIHALGPGPLCSFEEAAETLKRSLAKALAIAEEYQLSSVAIPLPEAAALNGDAYTGTFLQRQFLGQLRSSLLQGDRADLTVWLSVPEQGLPAAGKDLHREVQQYVSAHYIDLDATDAFFSCSVGSPSPAFEEPVFADSAAFDDAEYCAAPAPREESRPAPKPAHKAASPFSWEQFRRRKRRPPQEALAPAPSAAPAPVAAPAPADSYRDQDKSFIEMVDWWIDRKQLTMKEFYIRANLNRAMLSNLRCHPDQIPKKQNALACAIGLRLSLPETRDLLDRAGFSLSRHVKSDVIVEYFIEHSIYDIFLINEELFANDLTLLGTG